MKRLYKKRQLWSLAAEETLIEIWKKYMPQLRATKKNNHIFKCMAEDMKELGFLLTIDELQNKIHNLTCKYRYVHIYTHCINCYKIFVFSFPI